MLSTAKVDKMIEQTTSSQTTKAKSETLRRRTRLMSNSDATHYTYRVEWSGEDDEHVATVAEFSSLSWLAPDPQEALGGFVDLV
jgi:hypothetical protein